MDKDDLRIAVAEARGWERKKLSERDAGGAIHRYSAWVRVNNGGDEEERLRLPDYPDSMDACMRDLAPEIEADKTLSWRVELVGTIYRAQILNIENTYRHEIMVGGRGDTPS